MKLSYTIQAGLDKLHLTGTLESSEPAIPFSLSLSYSKGENPNVGYQRTKFLLLEETGKKLRETYPGQEITMTYGHHGN